MTESNKKSQRIRSYVRRQGRMTPGQHAGFDDHWSDYGLELTDGLLDLEQVFGRQAPVILDIGFGMGTSLLSLAERHPERDYIGIDVHRPGVGKVLAAVAEKKLQNVRVYCDDAVDVLAKCISDESLDEVLLFFSDPWPKKRHHKRRLLQTEFALLVASKLKIGGSFHLATDWQDYAEHMMLVMTAVSQFTNVAGAGQFSERPDTRPETEFERRGQRLNHEVWDLIFTKL